MPPALVPMLLGLLVLSVLGGGLAVWAMIGAARFEGRPILRFTPRRVVPWSGFQAGTSALLFVFAPTALLSLLHYGFGEAAPDKGGVPTRELLPLLLADAATKLVLVAGVVLWLRSSGANREDLGWRIQPLDIPIGVAGFLALCLVVYPLQAVLQQFGKLRHPVERVLSEGLDPLTLLGMFVVAVVVAPLVEEFLFRVVLQGWLEKFWVMREQPFEESVAEPMAELVTGPFVEPGSEPVARPLSTAPAELPLNPYEPPHEAAIVDPEPLSDPVAHPTQVMWLPIVVTSLIFAVLHAAAWPAPVPLFFLSLGLGYVYQRTHRLGPSVAMHATVNGVSVLMLAVQPLVNPGS